MDKEAKDRTQCKNDVLTLEEIRKKFHVLLDIAKCAVCLKDVRQENVQCVNGHLLCSKCKADLETCPVCKDKLSNSKSSHFISQVLEVLPICCKYRNCPKILKNCDDDHEKYCGFKPTNCKRCLWKGQRNQIFDHCVLFHSDCLPKSANRIEPKFCIDKKMICSVQGHFNRQFFWEETFNDPAEKTFTKTWQMVPYDKPKHDIFVTLTFKSKSGPFITMKIKLNLDPDVPSEENSISIPHRMLSSFIDNNGRLHYSVWMETF